MKPKFHNLLEQLDASNSLTSIEVLYLSCALEHAFFSDGSNLQEKIGSFGMEIIARLLAQADD